MAPLSGVKPRAGERLPEPGVVGRDVKSAASGQLQPDAGRPAPHRAHHRHLDRAQQRDQPVGQGGQPALDGTRPAGARRVVGVAGDDVGAAAEVLARAGE